ncbi:MAG: hypothetical protein ABF649_14540 [Bacillus sp. (in: firmicutes)]
MNISQESRSFLEDLRLYLFSSGKNEKEAEEIISELEDHLYVAEKDGKKVDDIIGNTPKAYMEQLANEMSFDFKAVLKYIPIIILGAFSYIVMGDALQGGIKYSLLRITGYLFIFLFVLLLISVVFKYVASNKISKTKERLLFALLGIMPTILFIGLIYLDRYYDTTMISFGKAGNIAAILFSILVFVGISIWSKTWVSIILPILLFLPEFLLNKTSFQESTQLIVTSLVTFVGIGIYFLIVKNKEKR